MSSPDLYKANLLKSELKLVRKQLRIATALLARAQKHYHEPDSDGRQYCHGCDWYSPRHAEGHKDGCLVVDIAKFMVGR